MGRIVLVGVDNTKTALGAAEKAADFALALGHELHVVSAYSTSEAAMPRLQPGSGNEQVEAAVENHRATIAQLRKGAEAAADSVVETLRSRFPELSVQGRAVEGAPGAALIRESKTFDTEMVVVGNRNVQGFGRLLGSIATRVAREIDCDLHIVNTRKKGKLRS